MAVKCQPGFKKRGIIKVEFLLLGRCVTDITGDPSKRRCSGPQGGIDTLAPPKKVCE